MSLLPFSERPTGIQIRGVRQGDALEVLRSLPDESFHASLMDTAYESLERHRARGTTTRLKVSEKSSNLWFETFPNSRVPELMAEVYRVLKAPAYALFLCDDPTEEVYRPMARDAGFWVWPSWTWIKTRVSAKVQRNESVSEGEEDDPPESAYDSVRIGMGFHGRRSSERIMVLEKRTARQVPHAEWNVFTKERGKGRPVTHRGWSDLFFAPRIDRGYPTEKPYTLISDLLEQITSPGESVIDTFCGSGVVARVAMDMNRGFLVSDLSEEAVRRAQLATRRTT